MWKEIKTDYNNPIIKQHEVVAGQKENWWLVEIEKKDGKSSTAWGFPDEITAKNALNMARSLMKLGLPRYIDYKTMHKVSAPRKIK